MNKIKRQLDVIYNDNTLKDITIIHISDIHFNINTNKNKLDKIKEEIYLNNPDYVMITGDIIDNPSIISNKKKIKELVIFLTDIASFTKVLISLGNHDVFTDNDYKFFDKLNDLKNIYILNNDSYKDEFIYVSGFTLPSNYYYNMSKNESSEVLLQHFDNHRKLVNRLPDKLPKVSLIHSPINLCRDEVINKLKEYDILLSGHTHAGMVPDFLDKFFKGNTGIIAPNKNLFPAIARGKIEKNIGNKKITIIINGAITKLSLRSSKFLSKLNFVYNISINKIIITKKRGKYYD